MLLCSPCAASRAPLGEGNGRCPLEPLLAKRAAHAQPTFCSTVLCFEHEQCHNLDGSVLLFEARMEKKHYVRSLVARDQKMCQGLWGTIVGVWKLLATCLCMRSSQFQLQSFNVWVRLRQRGDHLTAVLRLGRRVYGNATVEFRRSEEKFADRIETWTDLAGTPLHLARWTLRVMSWAAALTLFLLELAWLHERGSVRDLYMTRTGPSRWIATSTVPRRYALRLLQNACDALRGPWWQYLLFRGIYLGTVCWLRGLGLSVCLSVTSSHRVSDLRPMFA